MGWRCSSFNSEAGLFEHLTDGILIAATKLSHFVTGRRNPADAVKTMWHRFLQWLYSEFYLALIPQ